MSDWQEQTCERCNGLGVIRRAPLRTCADCDGSGLLRTRECFDCAGTGEKDTYCGGCECGACDGATVSRRCEECAGEGEFTEPVPCCGPSPYGRIVLGVS